MFKLDHHFFTLKKIILQHRVAFIQAVFFIAVSAALVLLVPVWVKELVTTVIPAKNLPALLRHIGLGLAMLLLIEGFCYGRDFFQMRLSLMICAGIRRQVFASLLTAKIKAVSDYRRGDLLSRLTSDISVLQDGLRFGVFSLIPNMAIVLGLLGMMLYYSTILSVVALVLIGPISWVVKFFAKLARSRTHSAQQRLGNLNTLVDETITGALEIKAFVQEKRVQSNFDEANDRALRAQIDLDRARALTPAVVSFVAFATIGLLIFASCWMVFNELTPIANLTPFLTSLLLLFYPLEDVSRAFGSIGKIYAVLDRFEPILQLATEYPEATALAPMPRVKGQIIIEHVDFSYDRNFCINDLNLNIEAGETVAIVGPSGGGKTTLLTLIPRLMEPTAGTITLDRNDIRAYRLDTLRRQIGFVPQEPVLVSGTLLENLKFSCPQATFEETVAAAKAAHVDEFAMQLPQGYHTHIGQFGGKLSVGQRQRIAIARALLLDPPILIMDEPTSALDAESERLLQDSFRRLRQGRTTLIVTHRLSTIWEADRIIVMAEGKIIETGTHISLMQNKGLYCKLFSNQMFLNPCVV